MSAPPGPISTSHNAGREETIFDLSRGRVDRLVLLSCFAITNCQLSPALRHTSCNESEQQGDT